MITEVLLEREFVATAVEVEGRTVDVRIVPFGEVARVADPPDWDQYDEEWLPGCFDHQLNAANRVHANYQHERGISNVVGHGLSLRREDDGYHGTFTILETQNGDTALGLIKGGALPGVSLEAFARRSMRTAAGVVQRVKADLKGLAFCREGAFKGAQVLAVRTPPEQMLDADLMPHDLDPERVERLRAQGIVLPDRYTKAHPDDTGTPADAGTPDDGTRQPEPITSSEENGDERVTGGADASAAG
jgi:HK97 family phage prohead protease